MLALVLNKNKIQELAFLSYTVKVTNTGVTKTQVHIMMFLHMTSMFKSGVY